MSSMRWRHTRSVDGSLTEAAEKLAVGRQQDARRVGWQRVAVGLHGPIKCKEIRILSKSISENPRLFDFALAAKNLGLAIGFRNQDRSLAFRTPFDPLFDFGALCTEFICACVPDRRAVPGHNGPNLGLTHHLAHRAFCHRVVYLLGIVDVEQIFRRILDHPTHREIHIDYVFIAGEHETFFARGVDFILIVGLGARAIADGNLVDGREFRGFDRFDRPRPMIVDARRNWAAVSRRRPTARETTDRADSGYCRPIANSKAYPLP